MIEARFRRPTSSEREAMRLVSLQVRRHLNELRARTGQDRALVVAQLADHWLRQLVRQETRCRRALGELVIELRRRQAWAALGFARLGDYARERLGCSGSEADSAARVAEGLRRLPATARALDAGEISWTKARILVRVATRESEDRWLAETRRLTTRELGRCVLGQVDDETATAGRDEPPGPEESGASDPPVPAGAGSTLEAEVRALREEDDEEIDGEVLVRFRLHAPAWVWLLFRRAVELARRASGEMIPVWQAVEAIGAEAASAAPAAEAGGDDVEPCLVPDGRARRNSEARCGASPLIDSRVVTADRLPPGHDPPVWLASWLGLDEGELRDLLPVDPAPMTSAAAAADPLELDRRLRVLVHEMQRIDWRIGRWLGLLFGHRLERDLGFDSGEAYVTGRLGLGLRKARALLALDREAARAPMLGEAYREGRLSWVQANLLLPVLRGADDALAAEWIERARRVTVRRLSDEVGWAVERRAAGESDAFVTPRLGSVLQRVPLPTTADARVQMRAERVIDFTGPATVVAAFRRVILAFGRPREPAWMGLVRVLGHVAGEWSRSGRRRSDPVVVRDGYRCMVPGCSSRRNLHVHHIVFRSAGGGDEESNLVLVCEAHHRNGIHAGRIRLRGMAPHALVWELGARLRPGGRPFLRLRSGEVFEEIAGEPTGASGRDAAA